MIVISGALVLVALVLLVIGLVATSLPFVYASIAVSVVAGVFLVLGILQRRGEPLPEAAAADGPAAAAQPDPDGVTTVVSPTASAVQAGSGSDGSGSAGSGSAGSVLVVAGRPRYHVAGCRYLNGKDPDEVPVTDARADGFTSCGVCKPDDALAQQQPSDADEELVPAAEVAAAAPDAPEVPAPAVAARKTTRAGIAAAKRSGATKRPATSRAATSRAAAPAKSAAATKTTSRAPSKAAAASAPATSAATKAPAAKRAGGVVVIPDRGKFHRAACRFVRDAPDAQGLTKAQATKQGYAACGVCKP